MPTLRLRRFAAGINLSAEPFEIEDGQHVDLRNLLPDRESLEPRPGQELHIADISATVPGGMAKVYVGIGGRSGILNTGTRSPATIANDTSFGTVPWGDEVNAGAADGTYAKAYAVGRVHGSGPSSNYLKTTNFGMGVPATALIRGIALEVKRGNDLATSIYSPIIKDVRVRAVKSGTIQTTDLSKPEQWPVPPETGGPAEEYVRYGGPDELWGTTWTPAQVNASDFGFAFAVYLGSSFSTDGGTEFGDGTSSTDARARVDHVRAIVYYDDPAGGSYPGSEILAHVGTAVYSDKSGSWATVNGANPLSATLRMETLTYKGKVFVTDGGTGPWVYDPVAGTWVLWSAVSFLPKYLMLDTDRIYAAGMEAAPTVLRASDLGDEGTWPTATDPTGTDGALFYIGRDDGDYITGLRRVSGLKVIFKRRSLWLLLGDGADNWDLQPPRPVGAACSRVIVECGTHGTVWTDGAKVYQMLGTEINDRLGEQIEDLLEAVPDSDWASRCAAYWRGFYVLWYGADSALVYDFRSRAWYGPWVGIPAVAAVTDRDSGELWIASSAKARISKLAGTTDWGAPIPWRAETKHYDFGDANWEYLARSIELTGSGPGEIAVSVVADESTISTRTFVFPDTEVRRLVHPIRPRKPGGRLGIVMTSSGGGRVQEVALRAHELRRIS